jgi:glycosyltransferase involved in cell wall biosynthesis
MKLAIVIPAYNEEKAIGAIVRRSIDARRAMVAATPVTAVEILVVSDGSTDATEQIARQFEPEITVIAYSRNRGYGAAIKRGFSATDADLVSFLDADGTCDPLNFIPMVNRLIERNADVCIGSRMGPGSKMPSVRRLGNLGYRMIINCLGDSRISDAASGMRVILRSSLAKLSPLPDGLDFTPAMSCRAVMDPSLKIEECPIPYEERVGRSKLSVFRDGLRFLKNILNIAVSFRPVRFFAPAGIAFLLLGIFYALPLLHHYVATRTVEEGMVYRIYAIIAFLTCGLFFFGTGVLMERVVRFVHPQSQTRGLISRLINFLFVPKVSLVCGAILLAGTVLLTARSFLDYVFTGVISQHWSHVAAGVLLGMLTALFFVFGLMGQAINVLFWHQWNQKWDDDNGQHSNSICSHRMSE